jgi:Ca2+-binding EF-hand superfamily protein
MVSSKDLCEYLWTSTNMSLVLFNQMEYASDNHSSSPSLSSEISSLCIELYSTLISHELYQLFNSHKNFSFHKLCIHMLLVSHSGGGGDRGSGHSSSDDGGCNLSILNYLLTSLISSPTLAPILISFDLLNELFTIFIKFKHNSTALSEIFQTTQLSSLYNIQTTRYLTLRLTEFLNSSSSSIQFIKPDHIERIQQLHQIILTELRKGRLQQVAPVELQQMTEALLDFLKLIVHCYEHAEGCASDNLLSLQRERVIRDCQELIDRWNSDLNEAFAEGINAPSHRSLSSDMEMQQQQGIPHPLPLLPNSRHFSGNDLIIVAVPLWEPCNSVNEFSIYTSVFIPLDLLTLSYLINGFCVMCQMNVLVNYLSPQTNSLTTLTTQTEFNQLYTHLQRHGVMSGTHVVMTLYLTQISSSSVSSGTASGLSSFNSVSMSSFHNPFESNAYQLKQKEIALKQLQRSLQSQGKPFNLELMSLFYDYIRDCNGSQSISPSSGNGNGSNEITQEQFVAALTSEKLNYSPQFAADIFHAFDTDHNGSLSLTEISIGFAKLMNSNFDEKLELIFSAYDRDHNGVLDLDELVDMIHVATGLPYEEAREYAIAVGNEVDENGNNTIEFDEFKQAVYKKLIPLEMSWSDSVVTVPQRQQQQQSQQQRGNLQKLWKQSNTVIQSVGNRLPQIFQPPNRSQSCDFSGSGSGNLLSSFGGATRGASGEGPLPGTMLRRAFSADFNSEGYEESPLDALGVGQGDREEREGIYTRRRSQEDDLESKFLNRKQRSHSNVVFQDEVHGPDFSPHDNSSSSSPRRPEGLHTFSSENSPAPPPTGTQSCPSPLVAPAGGREADEGQGDFARPPTPILSLVRRNSELPPLEIPPAPSPGNEGEDSRKRSSKDIAKSSPAPTPPEKSAIRESKMKDIKKNPFSKSPK